MLNYFKVMCVFVVFAVFNLMMLMAQPPPPPAYVPLAQKAQVSQDQLIPKVPPIAQDELLYTPESSVQWALHDLKGIPTELQQYIRYLSLYNIPKKDRQQVAALVSFVVNSLSTRRNVYIPSFVPGSEETVIRINIKDYDWKREVWEELAKKGSGVRPYPEPYFHSLIEKLVTEKRAYVDNEQSNLQIEVIVDNAPVYAPGKVAERIASCNLNQVLDVIEVHEDRLFLVRVGGTKGWIEKRFVKEVVRVLKHSVVVKTVTQQNAKEKVYSQAPWLTSLAIADLIRWSQSESPVVRADWFIANAIVPPAYYKFLNLGNDIKDFENLVFSDQKKSTERHLQDKGVVVHSSVARNNRTLTRSSTLTGGYIWVSHDTLKSVDDRKYIQNLLDEKFDATEVIGTLPNKLQAYFVTDAEGKRLDFANPDVAIDNTAVDRIVRTGRSCIICHSDGIRPIDDEVRQVTEFFRSVEQIRLLIPEEKKAYRVRDLFGSYMIKQIAADQQIYQDAVNSVTGLDMRKNASALSDAYDKYAEYLITKEVLQREVGLPLPQLEKYIRMSDDPIILGMIKNPVRALRRDQFEESYTNLMLMILSSPPTGYKVPARPGHDKK